MTDLWTIMWKETTDLLFKRGRLELLRPLIFIALLGIFLPLNTGLTWLSLPPNAVLIILYIPFIFILNYIADAIAGERERHTLETLLASRVSDRAILFGKVIVTVGYAWGIDLVSLVLGWVTVNLSSGQGKWQFYTPLDLLIAVLALSLLISFLAASGGVLVSLHAATVRQAQQTLLLGTLVLGVVVFLASKAVPASVINSLTSYQLFLIVMIVLAVLDAALLTVAMISFQRSRLILS